MLERSNTNPDELEVDEINSKVTKLLAWFDLRCPYGGGAARGCVSYGR